MRWSAAKAALAAVRETVFMREQGVPEALEWDGLDETAMHFLAEDKHGRPIGTGRLLADGQIGRMAVLAPWRSRGVGTAILEAILTAARSRGVETVRLHAQNHAVAFYQRFGFTTVSEAFLDAGIPHVSMQLHLGRDQETRAASDESSKL